MYYRFWFFKFLLLVGLTVGAFFIPDGIFTTGTDRSPKFLALLPDMLSSEVPSSLWRDFLWCVSRLTVLYSLLSLLSLFLSLSIPVSILSSSLSLSLLCRCVWTSQCGTTLAWWAPSYSSSSSSFCWWTLLILGIRTGWRMPKTATGSVGLQVQWNQSSFISIRSFSQGKASLFMFCSHTQKKNMWYLKGSWMLKNNV